MILRIELLLVGSSRVQWLGEDGNTGAGGDGDAVVWWCWTGGVRGDHDPGARLSFLTKALGAGEPAPEAVVPTQRFEPTGFDVGERDFGVGSDHGVSFFVKDEGRPTKVIALLGSSPLWG